ncbi:gp58-like protein [Oceanobacillus oncorhynchi]|uniref:Gp58-like protein n=1 Tax=Oceanobacillus oncorhynchi TaxID=545501 RepID=A0A0A1ME45_9BACI|nr:phage tail protein [Oceanobacillus oncorhynchi]CEI81313.1 gp58-like protein [Oceanobacillus oncorhynchi]
MELYIFSQYEQPLAVISEDTGLIETHYRIEVNGLPDEPFAFTIESEHPFAEHIKEENRVVFKDHEGDWRLMTIKEIDDINSSSGPNTIATCEPTFAAELNDHIIVERRFVNQTADVALTAAVNGTRWVAKVEVELGRATTNFYYISSTESIWKTIDVWGGELKDVVEFDEQTNEIKGCYVKIIQRLGTEQGQRFEIDHNTTEIGRTVLSYPKTALYGRGASLETEGGSNTRYIDFGDVEWRTSRGDPVNKPLGQKWVGDPEALDKYGILENGVKRHRDGEFSNQDYEDPEELLKATWEALQDAKRPEVNYRLSVELFDEKVSLGDTCKAIDRKFARPIEIQARVIAMEYDLMDIEGTMVVEMGQFLNLGDDFNDLNKKIEDIKNNPPKQQITEGSYPDRKPSTPVNLEAYGGMEVIQLYWDYADEMFINHYEVYGSRTEDFVPDTQHLLWRGDVSAFAHTVGTDEVWYYRVRAVNYHGRPSDWSVQVRAATDRVLTEDIMWGPELAERMRELHRVSDIIGENGVDLDQISKEAKDLLEQQARIYTDEEIEATRNDILSELDTRTDYLDDQVIDLNNRADGLVSRANDIDDLLYEHGGKFSSIETEIDTVNNRISASIEEIERIDDTVTSNSLELEAHAKSISAKLDELTYTRDKEGILESIEQNTLEIEATAKGLNAKADATIVDEIEDTVTGHTTELELLAAGLRSKVEESFVREAIGDIEIGGRNLIIGTNPSSISEARESWVVGSRTELVEGYTDGVNGLVNSRSEPASGRLFLTNRTLRNHKLKSGEIYTFSGWFYIDSSISLDNGANQILIRTYLETGSFSDSHVKTINVSEYDYDTWYRFEITDIIPEGSNGLSEPRFGLLNRGYVVMSGWQVEKGNKASDYQQAPEDILSVQENHRTLIDQNSREIALQSDSIIDMDGLIKDAHAEISVMSDEISERVTKTIFENETGYLRQSISDVRQFAEGIETTVSNIQIGGRNLFAYTQGVISYEPYNTINEVTETKILITINRDLSINNLNLTIRLNSFTNIQQPNTQYTVSGIWSHNGVPINKDFFRNNTFNTNPHMKQESIDINEDTGYVVITFRTGDSPYSYLFHTGVYADTGDTLEITNMQIEKGNKATDWTPAPEDTDQRMTDAESRITQLADEIDLKVDVDGIVSSINLSDEGIRIKGNLIHLDGTTLINDGVIQNAHIANGTIERAKLERAIIGTAQVENGAITNAKIASLNADKINAASLSAISANMGTVTAGRLLSNNNNMDLNLNTGNLTMRNADFTLGGGASIRFTDRYNSLTFNRENITAGVGFDMGTSGNPIVFMGSAYPRLTTNDYSYSGLIISSQHSQTNHGGWSSIVSRNFMFRDRTDYSKAIRIDLNSARPRIVPSYTGSYNYDLGSANNKFDTLHVSRIQGATVYVSNPVGQGGWAMETQPESGSISMTFRGINSGLNNFVYNLGSTANPFNFARINHLRPQSNSVSSSIGDSSNRYNYVYTNSLFEGSDVRIKDNVTDAKLGLAFINDLRLVDYRLIETEQYKNGVIAQELEQALINHGVDINRQSMVSADDEIMSVAYNQLIAPTIKAVQELDRKLEEEINWQRIEYQALKNKVTKLEDRIKQLEESAA